MSGSNRLKPHAVSGLSNRGVRLPNGHIPRTPADPGPSTVLRWPPRPPEWGVGRASRHFADGGVQGDRRPSCHPTVGAQTISSPPARSPLCHLLVRGTRGEPRSSPLEGHSHPGRIGRRQQRLPWRVGGAARLRCPGAPRGGSGPHPIRQVPNNQLTRTARQSENFINNFHAFTDT